MKNLLEMGFFFVLLLFADATTSYQDKAYETHYALDPSQAQQLALVEEAIEHQLAELQIDTIDVDLHSQNSSCFQMISRYLDEFHEDSVALDGSSGETAAAIVSRNPILIFKMIRRIYQTLIFYTLPICQDDSEYREQDVRDLVNSAFESHSLSLPTEQDFHDASLGILRIQYVYGLNGTQDMRVGRLYDIETKAFLNVEDCIVLSQKAMRTHAQYLAYQWFIAAQLAMKDHRYSPDGRTELKKKLVTLRKNLQLLGNVETPEQLRKKLEGKLQLFWQGQDISNYETLAPCRGEVKISAQEQVKLLCYYTRPHPYFFINPMKVEVHNREPLLLQFYDFVGDCTIRFTKQLSAHQFTRSAVASTEGPTKLYKNSRTSLSSIYLLQQDAKWPHPKMATWLTRAEHLTGLEIRKELASDYQVAAYSAMGGHYDFHRDYLQGTIPDVGPTGDRLATFLLFTEDVTLGGFTAFGRVAVKPVKGSALFWYNIFSNGNVDERTTHAGCPVILGYKEVVNLWIHQYDNMWKCPCTKNNQHCHTLNVS